MRPGADLRGAPPVIIGGVGGSGTRVVAQILSEAGVFMGVPRNRSEDNLWFQLLLKRPDWQAARPTRPRIVKGLRLVRDMNLGYLLQPPTGYGFVLGAMVERQRTRQKHLPPTVLDQSQETQTGREITYAEQGASPLISKLGRFIRSRRTTGGDGARHGWGWKEPASFLYLPYFQDAFGEFKYVHVMRNGLDMAFSQNQSQLLNYGQWFACDPGRSAETLRHASLKYWVAANDWVQDLMQRSENAGNCYTLKLEDLVADTNHAVAEMLEFLGIPGNPGKLAGLVHTPGSIDRYRNYDLNVFDPQDVSALARFGYPVPALS